MTDIAVAPRRGIKLGLWALGTTLLSALYLGIGLVLALLGQGQNGNEFAASIAYGMTLASFVIIPLALLCAVVLGIIALVRDRPLGKALGGIAIALILVVSVLIPLALIGSSDIVL